KCAAEFASSHLCTYREYTWTGSSVTPSSPNGFWLDDNLSTGSNSPNNFPRDRSTSYTCRNWRSNNGPAEYMYFFDSQGVTSGAQYNVCNVARSLACCGG